MYSIVNCHPFIINILEHFFLLHDKNIIFNYSQSFKTKALIDSVLIMNQSVSLKCIFFNIYR